MGRLVAANGPIDQRLEAIGIAHGNIGEDLAVDFHARRRQRADQTAVGQAVFAGRGIDPLNPEGAEIAFPQLAADIGVLERAIDRGIGRGDVVLAPAIKAFGLFQNAFAAQARRDRSGELWT